MEKFNGSGAMDMTAGEAIKKISDDWEAEKRAYDCFGVLLRMASLAGFTVEELQIKNRKSGAVYKKNESRKPENHRDTGVCEQPKEK